MNTYYHKKYIKKWYESNFIIKIFGLLSFKKIIFTYLPETKNITFINYRSSMEALKY